MIAYLLLDDSIRLFIFPLSASIFTGTVSPEKGSSGFRAFIFA
jgi:hypothetical protein